MKKTLLLLMTCLFTHVMNAQVCENDTVCAEGAWCWFADPRALHYENADGSINATYIGIARYKTGCGTHKFTSRIAG